VTSNEDGETLSVETDFVSVATARALHGLLDAPGDPPSRSDPLPPLWHWLAFLPRSAQNSLGNDGHPRRCAQTHPERFPQRMFAGARLNFNISPLVDQEITRHSRMTSMVEKQGRSGSLLLTSVENLIEVGGLIALVDEQVIMYRSPTSSSKAATLVYEMGKPEDYTWALDLDVNETLLFRFSALTYNAHRIHYDRQYAREFEGYPDLVVHGPLQAIGLAELCRRFAPDSRMISFEFRAIRPVFGSGVIHLRATRDGESVVLAAFDKYGQMSMIASALLEES
jgi:3-methylfumaryl-CoA hydratase